MIPAQMQASQRVAGIFRRRGGFTLLEMLIVISIIAFLAVILVVKMVGLKEQAKVKQSEACLDHLKLALSNYYQDFQAFPPGISLVAGAEWWRYLSFSGAAFMRPVKPDGSIVVQPYVTEDQLNLNALAPGTLKFPRDGWDQDIEYVYPGDNDAANLYVADARVIAPAMSAVEAYYFCVLISKGKDKQSTAAVGAPTGRITNTGAYEVPNNVDNIIRSVSEK